MISSRVAIHLRARDRAKCRSRRSRSIECLCTGARNIRVICLSRLAHTVGRYPILPQSYRTL